MSITVTETNLPGVLLVEPRVFGDERGFFLESYHREKYTEAGIGLEFVQDNHSRSSRGVLRGLHYQLKHQQAKLLRVASGEILDVAVDIRTGSPHFGKWTGQILSSENKRQLFVPAGFAHGFAVLSETAEVLYKASDYYAPDDEYGIAFNDPDIQIDWGVTGPLLSDKDRGYGFLKDMPQELLPEYQ